MMTVGRRLMLALLPAIFGLFAAAGLAYYGEFQRQAPEWFVVVALVSTAMSLVVAWLATRHVANRIERLADWRNARGSALQRAAGALQEAGVEVAPPAVGTDELDDIERIVDRLTVTCTGMHADRDRLATLLEEHRAEYARLVGHASSEVLQQLEAVRLPLHILLENRFGELNENQEEMLGAARDAAEAADHVALRLRDVASLDLGTLCLREDHVRVSDLLATILPGVSAEAEAKGVALETSIVPAIPTFTGDRERLQEALGILLREAVQRSPAGQTVRLTADVSAGELHIVVGSSAAAPIADRALPLRIVGAHGGRLVDSADGLAIHLPLGPLEAPGRRSPGTSGRAAND